MVLCMYLSCYWILLLSCDVILVFSHQDLWLGVLPDQALREGAHTLFIFWFHSKFRSLHTYGPEYNVSRSRSPRDKPKYYCCCREFFAVSLCQVQCLIHLLKFVNIGWFLAYEWPNFIYYLNEGVVHDVIVGIKWSSPWMFHYNFRRRAYLDRVI